MGVYKIDTDDDNFTYMHYAPLPPLRVETPKFAYGVRSPINHPLSSLMSISSGVFYPWRSKNRGVPLTRRVALTAVLHNRADCDVHK